MEYDINVLITYSIEYCCAVYVADYLTRRRGCEVSSKTAHKNRCKITSVISTENKRSWGGKRSVPVFFLLYSFLLKAE